MRTQTGSHPTYALILWFERFFIYLYFKNQDLIIKVLQGVTKVQCCLVTEENKTNSKNNPSQVTADELYILISTCHTNHKWWMSDLGLGLTVTLYILKIHQTYWAVTEWRAVRYQGSRQKAKGCQQTLCFVLPLQILDMFLQLQKAVASGLMAKAWCSVGNLGRFHGISPTALTAGSLYKLRLRDANTGA